MSILYLRGHHGMAGRLLGALLLIMASHSFIWGQVTLDMPQIYPVSPTAATMEKFHSYPVDYCTGVPEISIPLYEIVAGDITIPVTLSYHASGLKPQEGSGIVGTNWSLSLEPSISREVRGKDDRGNYGWLQDGSYRRGAPPVLPGIDQINYMEEVVSGLRDSQPDKFMYKLPHGGGSGYMLYRESPMVTCPRTNDVVRWGDYDKMNITDDKGFYYEFNGAVEKLLRVSSDTPQLINRWLCTSIRSPNRSQPSVTFSYDNLRAMSGTNKGAMGRGEVIISRPESEDAIYLTEHFPMRSDCYAVVPDYYSQDKAYFYDYKAMLRPDYSGGIGVDYSSSSGSSSNEMEVAQLTEVNFLGNRMRVSYTAVGNPNFSSEVLDRLEVIDEKGKLVKCIRFYLSTYNPYTTLTKLDSVSVWAPGVETRTHKFNYNGGLNVPSVNTLAIDHWGFCNGRGTEVVEKTVPSFRKVLYLNKNGRQERLLLEYEGANREANDFWTNLGMLIQITDPQGLETHFEYEGNYAAFALGAPGPEQEECDRYLRPVGGLRVKTIRTYDPKVQKTIYKRYTYGLEWSIGSGVTWGGGAIPHIVTERDYQTNIFLATESNYLKPLTIYGNMPVSEITFHNGSAVLYSNVRERVEGGGAILETLYVYHVPFHAYDNVMDWDREYGSDDAKKESRVNDLLLIRSFKELNGLVCALPNNPKKHSDEYTHISDHNWLAGKLNRVERYKDRDTLLSTTLYEFDRVGEGPVVSVDIPVRRISVSHSQCQDNPGQYSWDNIFTTDRFYPPEDGGAAQTTFYLDIGSYTFLEREHTSEYRGGMEYRFETFTTDKRFEHELSYIQGSSLEPRRITTTRSDGSTAIDEFDYLDGTFPGILSAHRHTEGNSWKENRIIFKEGTSLPDKVMSATDQCPEFRDEVVYTEYDSYKNLIEVRGKDGTPVTYLWGYRSRFPVAMIENATREEVFTAMGFEPGTKDLPYSWLANGTPIGEVWYAINTLRATLTNANVYSCEYEPLTGVIAVTDPNNVTTRYEYDGWNRLTGSYFLDTTANKVTLQRFLYHLGEK